MSKLCDIAVYEVKGRIYSAIKMPGSSDSHIFRGRGQERTFLFVVKRERNRYRAVGAAASDANVEEAITRMVRA